MHSAPSVTYPVGRSRVWGLAAGLIWLCGALVTGLWCYQVDSVGWRQWLAMVSVLVCGGVAVVCWLASPEGELQWDGLGWLWAAQGVQVAGLLTVHLDLQQYLLLCLCSEPGGRRWLWLEQRNQPGRWRDLRRAVYSRARVDTDGPRSPLPD